MSEVSEGLCATAGGGLQVTALVSGAACFGQDKGLYPPKPAVRGVCMGIHQQTSGWTSLRAGGPQVQARLSCEQGHVPLSPMLLVLWLQVYVLICHWWCHQHHFFLAKKQPRQ